jgi:PST family polysaccharide transporter
MEKLRTLIERPVVAAVLGNAGWLLAEKALRLGLGVAVSALVARYLGPEQFGVLNYALALVALFAVLANVGLDAVVVREIARNPGDREVLLGSAFALKAAGGALALCGALGAAFFLRDENGSFLWVVLPAALALVFQAFETIDLWFQAQLQARSAAVARNAAFIAVAIVKLALVWFHAPLQAFAWAVFLEAALTAAALIVAYRMQHWRVSAWRPRADRIGSLLRQGWPLVLSGFMVAIYMRIDQVMLGYMVGPEAVGVYSSAVFLSEPWFFVPVAIVTSAAPALARCREADTALYVRRLEQMFRLLLLLSVAIALPLSLCSDALIALVFGTAFQGAGAVLAVHAWATVFVALGVGSGQYLVLEDLTRISLQRTLAGAALNIVLNILWIPEHGALGSAWATLFSYALASLFLFQTPGSRRCLGIMLRAVWPSRLARA